MDHGPRTKKIFVLIAAVILVAAMFAAFMTARDGDDTEVEPETGYSWDLTTLFADDDAFYAVVERVNNEVVPGLKEKAAAVGTADGVLAYLLSDDEALDDYGSLRAYARLPVYLDIRCDRSDYTGAAWTVYSGTYTAKECAESILSTASAAYQQQLLDDERLDAWEPFLTELFAGETETDPLIEESLNVLTSLDDDYFNAYYQVFWIDIQYQTVTAADGTTIVADYSAYADLTSSNDRAFRETVRSAYYAAFSDYDETASYFLDGHARCAQSIAELNGHGTVLEQYAAGGGVSGTAVYNLLAAAYDGSANIERYYGLIEKQNGYETMSWDIYDSLTKDAQTYYTVDEAKSIILAALKPLGEEYLGIVEKAFTEGWVDLGTDLDRQSGWRTIGYDGAHPWIIGHWGGNFYSVSALAHELGHAVNFYLAAENNPCRCNGVSEGLGEVPSLLNELLLTESLAQQAGSEEERLFYLEQELSIFDTNFNNNAAHLSFEGLLYQRVAEGGELTAEWLNAAYLDCMENFQPGVSWSSDRSCCGWVNSPEMFGGSFSNAVYLQCIVVALEVLKGISDDGRLSDYQTFLNTSSAYGTDKLFALLGVDPEDETFGQSVNEYMSEIVDELEGTYGH